ncbi:calcium-independent phospholipase A2-gamma [Chanos chanos]|uniref:Calcium-independent phospholipase A2-gamma n=1 Tax=Chanos chanos TaxID=29144 RepID=A0A6J2VFM2_CHACN|nr:calcium-independent phospholipase A2-gamma-like [Chanos chanos]
MLSSNIWKDMTFRWVQDAHVLSLKRAVVSWHTNGEKLVLPLPYLLRHPYCRLHARRPFSYKAGHFSWNHTQSQKNRVRRGWLCRIGPLRHRLGFYTSILNFNSSASLGSADLSHRMSRLRSTLESVSKAVSGTQADILARIARLKPSATQEENDIQANPEEPPQEQKNGSVAAATATPVPAPSAPSPPTTSPISPSTSPTSLKEHRERRRPRSIEQRPQVSSPVKASQVKSSASTPNDSSVPKQTTPLFHPSSLSVNLDETYNYLAHHVNAYFGSFIKAEETKLETKNDIAQSDQTHQNQAHKPTLVPVSNKTSSMISATPSTSSSPASSKKGLGHYLSYSAPTVQAFVGSYIAPLVPRFRGESKSVPGEQNKPSFTEDAVLKQKETIENKEQKAAEEKAKRLMLQREKIIARVSVDNRTRALVQAIHRASDVRLYISRVEELSYHLLEFPETRVVAVKEKVIPCLLRLRQASDPALKAAVREALALVGYINPVRSRGIRILSIDGGGTRGLVALQTLHKLEELSGKPIYKLFDYICGVSTGAILGFMLGVFQIPLNECEELYRKLGSDVFKQNVIVGTVKMGWSHAFYDSEIWEKVLKERMGSSLLVETSRNPYCPKVAAVSTVVNRGTPLKAYVFRNYNLPPGVRSHYRGSCQHKLWEAIRASSAAPGYFQEFALGNDLHQDGGLLINNPTALAVHECKCLWPSTPVQCVVSLGTGRFEASSKHSATYTSLKTKLTNVISSATDTEEVHTMLDALLPPHTYFRFNPYMQEDVALDENRQEKLDQLQAEGVRYLERNKEKLKKAVRILTREKSVPQRVAEWVKLRVDMYDGMPSFSKR